MLNFLNRHFENLLASSLLVVMASAIFLQVITRSLGYSLSWTEELARFCLIWLVYIGVSFAVLQKKHIRIDAITRVLNDKEQKYLSLFSDGIFYLFACIILFLSTQMVVNLYLLEQISPALGMPMWLVYLAAPVGFALASLRLLQQIHLTFVQLASQGESQ